MSLFPRIQNPCPYKSRLGEVMVGSHCTKCDREVIDIGAMSDAERLALIGGCQEEICVSFKLVSRSALAAAALGAAFGMVPAAMAAESTAADGTSSDQLPQDSAASADDAADEEPMMEIIVGGLRLPKNAKWVETQAEARPANLAELPVTYEDAPTGVESKPAGSPQQPQGANAQTPTVNRAT